MKPEPSQKKPETLAKATFFSLRYNHSTNCGYFFAVLGIIHRPYRMGCTFEPNHCISHWRDRLLIHCYWGGTQPLYLWIRHGLQYHSLDTYSRWLTSRSVVRWGMEVPEWGSSEKLGAICRLPQPYRTSLVHTQWVLGAGTSRGAAGEPHAKRSGICKGWYISGCHFRLMSFQR